MKWLKDNGLTIVLMVATIATLTAMLFTGFSVYNDELRSIASRWSPSAII